MITDNDRLMFWGMTDEQIIKVKRRMMQEYEEREDEKDERRNEFTLRTQVP